MELNIYHLYPDVLNLYGDRGNVLCMQRRLEWRGMQANIVNVPIGTKLDAKNCDLIFIGGGQDFEQEVLLDDLKGEKTAELKAAIEDGVPVLAICGGYQMLGQYYKTWDGQQCDFTGALDLYTVGSEQRMIGNYMFSCEEAGCNIVGFENHSGKTYLGSGVRPLGRVLEGSGNNGEDGTEGARYKNVFASYSHGCLLPKNPKLADLILQTATRYLFPILLLFSVYVLVNGHLSPGGGFSGGTVLGAALILYVCAYGSKSIYGFFGHRLYSAVKVSALCLYSLIILYYAFTGANGLPSAMPLGTPGRIFSAGFILPINVAVGFEVACTMFGFYAYFRKGDL